MLSMFSFTLLALSASSESVHAFPRHEPRAASNADSTVSAAWYAGWHAETLPLANVSWEKYTHLTYSFTETTPSVHSISLNGSDSELLPDFVATAHRHKVKALVSTGGWGGSQYFSSDVRTPENRTAFVTTIIDFVQAYRIDGIDIDWEYPGNQGIGCNVVSPNDTANFLEFLQELRADPIGATLIITAAAPISPWKDSNGNSSTDVSAFAKYIDWIAIMNYDIWGSWSTAVGPNAPLNDTCASAADQQGSAASAVAAWTKAGIPPHQIVLAVPSYGHSSRVDPSAAFECNSDALIPYPDFNPKEQPLGDSWDNVTNIDSCGSQSGPSGVFSFWGLIEGGFLSPDGSVAEGIAYRYDECSQTPYVYNETSQVMVSYDDTKSFGAKGAFIKETKLRGFAVWEAAGDYHDILLDAIRSAVGF